MTITVAAAAARHRPVTASSPRCARPACDLVPDSSASRESQVGVGKEDPDRRLNSPPPVPSGVEPAGATSTQTSTLLEPSDFPPTAVRSPGGMGGGRSGRNPDPHHTTDT